MPDTPEVIRLRKELAASKDPKERKEIREELKAAEFKQGGKTTDGVAKGSATFGHEKQMTASVYLVKCAKAAIKDDESENTFVEQFKPGVQELARKAYKIAQGGKAKDSMKKTVILDGPGTVLGRAADRRAKAHDMLDRALDRRVARDASTPKALLSEARGLAFKGRKDDALKLCRQVWNRVKNNPAHEEYEAAKALVTRFGGEAKDAAGEQYKGVLAVLKKTLEGNPHKLSEAHLDVLRDRAAKLEKKLAKIQVKDADTGLRDKIRAMRAKVNGSAGIELKRSDPAKYEKLLAELTSHLDAASANDVVGSFSAVGELRASELAEHLAKRGGPYTPHQERTMAKYGYGGKAKDSKTSCPECKGKGCKTCGGSGWVQAKGEFAKDGFEDLPKAEKVAAWKKEIAKLEKTGGDPAELKANIQFYKDKMASAKDSKDVKRV
jgi:hypothetical protein